MPNEVRPRLRRGSSVLAVVLVAALGASCRGGAQGFGLATRSPDAISSHVTHGSLTVVGMTRSYRLFVPSGLDPSQPVPLVVVLHGGTGTNDGAAVQTGFDAEAEREHFLAVYPQGVGRSWNAGTCCGAAQRFGVDDVGFVSALLDHLEETRTVDRGRVFATGISNGAMMAARLACELSDRFAAAALVSGGLLVDCNPARPVSALFIHGTADQHVPYEGGVGAKALQPTDYLPVRTVVEGFASRDGCSGTPRSTTEGAVTTDDWPGCREGTAVELITIEGGGHSWPGGERMSDRLDPPSDALDATPTIWAFFAEHPQGS